ncbi:hypothetical protein F0562_033247 [Nyssa sinensis]|uniref:Uncharacterized protein n=1 Tax=Nyssa sinensis TaxID=561372 RepID=A0A5J5ARN8_9ASTE|nr:hypothetical protein F0562_033247 [Nyssa sinensis]
MAVSKMEYAAKSDGFSVREIRKADDKCSSCGVYGITYGSACASRGAHVLHGGAGAHDAYVLRGGGERYVPSDAAAGGFADLRYDHQGRQDMPTRS